MKQSSPRWLSEAVVYCIYPEIFSASGNLKGITAQLPRLQKLGVTVLWLLPVTPRGQATPGHPNFQSPYCVQDYTAIAPDYGTPDDLAQLVRTAHRLGLKVILDAVLNHTSWDNPLVKQHPEYYEHTDGDKQNPLTIRQAFNFADVAQLDYANQNLRTYIIRMLQQWVTRYDLDGFRFDTASNPASADRKIPADFWNQLGTALLKTKPDLLLLGECLDPALANNPFPLDYGWNVSDSLQRALQGESGSAVRTAWQRQTHDYPTGMLHLSLQDTWDAKDRDVRWFGGPSGAMAAAFYNFTINGVPLLYNGMEVGNDAGTVNPHQKINWNAPHRKFPRFYQELIALRHRYPALQQGTVTWLPNSAPSQVLTYRRSSNGAEFLILINLSEREVKGSVAVPARQGWTEITPFGAPAPRHAQPPDLLLKPHDFALFKRPLPTHG